MSNQETQTIVMVGNIADGFTAYGPFASFDLALGWAEDSPEVSDEAYTLLDLAPPHLDEIEDGSL